MCLLQCQSMDHDYTAPLIGESLVLKTFMLSSIEAAFVICGYFNTGYAKLHFFHLLQIYVDHRWHASFKNAILFGNCFKRLSVCSSTSAMSC